jgi:ribose 1,5-bisphosphokinase
MKQIRNGMLFLFTGNPGSGKDSIISGIKEKYDGGNLYVPNRIITRPLHTSEDYKSVSRKKFDSMILNHQFSFFWESYGIYYGLPSDIIARLNLGDVVLANVSRKVVSRIKSRILNTKCIFISVDPIKGLSRIKKRGREGLDSIQFIERKNKLFEETEFEEADVSFDNSFEIEECTRKILDYIIRETAVLKQEKELVN